MDKNNPKGSLIEGKSRQLFRDSEMIDRKKTSLIDFEESLKGDIAYNIITACEKGVQISAEQICATKPTFQNRNFKANLVNSNIQGHLAELFPLDSGICKGHRFFLKVNGHRLFPKKIDKKYRPSNIPTKAVSMYNDQMSDDASDTMPITYIGYRVSSSFTELLGVYAVHMSGGDIEWIIDFADLAYAGQRVEFNNTISEVELDIPVKPKRHLSRQKEV